MNTPPQDLAEKMLRYAKKIGKVAFLDWLNINPQFEYLMEDVKTLDSESYSPLFS